MLTATQKMQQELDTKGYSFVRTYRQALKASDGWKKELAAQQPSRAFSYRETGIKGSGYVVLTHAYAVECSNNEMLLPTVIDTEKQRQAKQSTAKSPAQRKREQRQRFNTAQRNIDLTPEQQELEQLAMALIEQKIGTESLKDIRAKAYLVGLINLANTGAGAKLKKGRDYQTIAA